MPFRSSQPEAHKPFLAGEPRQLSKRKNQLHPLLRTAPFVFLAVLGAACGGQTSTEKTSTSTFVPDVTSTPSALAGTRCVAWSGPALSGPPEVDQVTFSTPAPTPLPDGITVPVEDLVKQCLKITEYKAKVDAGGSYGVVPVAQEKPQGGLTPVPPTDEELIPGNKPGETDPNNLFFNLRPAYPHGELKLITGSLQAAPHRA